MSKIIAIAMSDLHARTTTPQCRKDDYAFAMLTKIRFIADLCREHDCMLIDGGDLFDSWKGSPRSESMLLRELPELFFSVAGNHEMPYHNASLIEDSSFNVLASAGRMKTGNLATGNLLIEGFPYSRELPKPRRIRGSCDEVRIAVYHGMVWADGKRPDVDGIEGVEASEIAEIFKGYTFVIVGHNHDTFVHETEDGPTIINPGSVMRSSIAQMQHKPCVFALYDDGHYEKIELPIEADVFAEDVYKRKQDRDARMEAFVEQLSVTSSATADFAQNIETFLCKNKVKKQVCSIVHEIIGGAQ